MVNKDVVSILRGHFTETQIQCLVHHTRAPSWKEEDISRAVTLRSLSPKAYRFLREKWNFPLPSPSTISRWVSKLKVEPGALLPVIELLHNKASTMSEKGRLCAISFDETAVAQEWSYDIGTDTLYSPPKNVQCVMLRGLTVSWKQIIFYAFDTPMTKDILFDLICKVEAVGFIVMAMVCDLGSTNMRLWRTLGINVNNTSFTNPAASREIFVFADAPHLLKLTRNNFLDHGFTLDGHSFPTVTSSSVREIIVRSVRDLKTTHRLSDKHINVEGVKRMNVRLAAQLMSETTAKTIKYFGEQGLLKSYDWDDTSKCLAIVDSWFDLFNSRAPVDKKDSRVAYGIHLQDQNNVLETMMNTMQSMRVGSSKSLYPFQKGILVSCKSLSKLFECLKSQFGLQFLMTCKLNQDSLEHFFGHMRQMGVSHQHPNAEQVKFRLRTYLLGRNCELIGNNYNTNKDNTEGSLTEMSFPENIGYHCDITTDSLNSELMLSALMFALDEKWETEVDEDPNIKTAEEGNFEECMESEGLRYVAGFIARKFPQYAGLGTVMKSKDNTWIGAICRKSGKLFIPSDDFYLKVKKMEEAFIVVHGKRGLKPGKYSMSSLSSLIRKHVDLPKDVVAYFVKCRIFFRMRILNRNLKNGSHKEKKKIKKTPKVNFFTM